MNCLNVWESDGVDNLMAFLDRELETLAELQLLLAADDAQSHVFESWDTVLLFAIAWRSSKMPLPSSTSNSSSFYLLSLGLLPR